MITVVLYGHLREHFGERFDFAVRDMAGAIRAMAANFKNFRSVVLQEDLYLIADQDNGSLGREDALSPLKDGGVLRIIPKISGRGFFSDVWNAITNPQVILGAVIAFAGVVFLQPWLFDIGATMVLGGIAGALMGKAVPPVSQEDPENATSFAFGGVVNTTTQGNPVPILYGRLIVGSQVISSGITTDDIREDA